MTGPITLPSNHHANDDVFIRKSETLKKLDLQGFSLVKYVFKRIQVSSFKHQFEKF